MDVLVMAVGSIAVGLVVGVLSGMLGIGGGTILVPVFKLGYLMESIACTATSLFTIIPTSVSGAVSHLRNKTCIPKLGVAAGLGGAVTSPIGVHLATVSPGWLIMVAAAVIITYSAYTMLRKALAAPRVSRETSRVGKGAGTGADADSLVGKGTQAAVGAGSGASANAGTPASAGASAGTGAPARAAELPPAPPIGRKQIAQAAGIGLVAGVASGYVGVGGGFLMVPMMIQLIHTPMKLTSGTSLIAVMILAIPGVVYQAMLGNVNWIAGIAVACGSIPGAAVGARLIPYIPERTLRFIFSGFLFVAAVLLVLNQLGVY